MFLVVIPLLCTGPALLLVVLPVVSSPCASFSGVSTSWICVYTYIASCWYQFSSGYPEVIPSPVVLFIFHSFFFVYLRFPPCLHLCPTPSYPPVSRELLQIARQQTRVLFTVCAWVRLGTGQCWGERLLPEAAWRSGEVRPCGSGKGCYGGFWPFVSSALATGVNVDLCSLLMPSIILQDLGLDSR